MIQLFPKRGRPGFSLIELMVTALISALVLTVMFTVFRGSQRSYSTQEFVAEMQQNLRVAMSYVTRDMRMAGAGLNTFDEKIAEIEMWNGAAWEKVGKLTPVNSAAGPDSIGIMYGQVKTGSYETSLDGNLLNPTAPINVSNTDFFADGNTDLDGDGNNELNDHIVVTDGITAALFVVTPGKTGPGPGTLPHAPGTPPAGSPLNSTSTSFHADSSGGFLDGSRVFNFGQMKRVTYSIDNITDPAHPRLVATDQAGTQTVVAENIEDLQIHYFYDDGTEGEDPVAANKVNNIIAARVTLVARTQEVDKDAVSTFGPIAQVEDHANVGPNDGYRRSVLTSMIEFRNQ